MALTPEEQRALLWQLNQKARVAFQRMLQAKLRAPAAPALQQKKNWEPVRRTRSYD